jgi:uncharacterized protein
MKIWNRFQKLGFGILLSASVLLAAMNLLRVLPLLADTQGKPTPGTQANPQGQRLPITAQALIHKQKIDLEVASTPEEQEIGLMYRTELPANRGMLFAFDPPRPVSFWMKNTLIPLDIVFLYQGKVRTIASTVPPCKQVQCPTYGSNDPIDQVIELKSGRAAELGLKVGDTIQVKPLPTPKKS